MATRQMSEVLQHLRRTVFRQDEAGLTDGQLLEDHISRRDDAALAVLVRRHGPMVWGVCRRVLRNHHDAEDAFQATFLVLVRKAASVVPREMVANWLYGVAHQTALKARATAARRKGRERQVAQMPEPLVGGTDLWRDLRPLLDNELSRLPDKYRAVLVLCDLEGKTRKEAARQIGCPEGTVAGRLARARTMLAKRLARHGLAVSGGTLATLLAQKVASASAPASVMASTIKAASLFAAGQAAATGAVSGKVVALTEGVLKTMLCTKPKVVMVLLVAALCGAAGLIYQTRAAEPSKATPAGERAKAPKAKTGGLEGTWKAVSLEVDGTRRDSDALLKKQPVTAVQWTFTGKKIKMRAGGKSIEADYSHDSSQAPRQIDLTFHFRDEDVEEVVKALGIYSLDGDTLKVCFIDGGEVLVRPLKFETKKVKGTIFYTFRREASSKKSDKEKRSAIKKGEKPRPDGERLQGTWKLVSEVDDGEKVVGQVGDEWTFKGRTVKVVSPATEKSGSTTEYMRFRLDETTNPKLIDCVEGTGDDLFDTAAFDKRLEDADERIEGVYAIAGDTVKICISRKKRERPTAFECKRGSDYILIVLRRARPKDAPKGGKRDKP